MAERPQSTRVRPGPAHLAVEGARRAAFRSRNKQTGPAFRWHTSTVGGEHYLELWETRLDDVARLLAKRGVEPLTREQLSTLAQDLSDLADERDKIAEARDRCADDRDAQGEQRDVDAVARDRRERAVADDNDRGFASRYLSARDRDDAAGDRADSITDRARAGSARSDAAEARRRAVDDYDAASVSASQEIRQLRAALEHRTVIGQAEGMLMQRYAIDADAAFAVLVRLSQAANVKLHTIAEHLTNGDEL